MKKWKIDKKEVAQSILIVVLGISVMVGIHKAAVYVGIPEDVRLMPFDFEIIEKIAKERSKEEAIEEKVNKPNCVSCGCKPENQTL